MKYLQVILVIIQLFVIKIVVSPAQKVSEMADAKSTYDLLLTRFNIYLEYYTLDEETKQLYEEAIQYGKDEAYEIGAIILEEAVETLKNDHESMSDIGVPSFLSGNPVIRTPRHDFNLSIISGLDFNRQEFELGFVESDSTVKEEFSKPYFGLSARYYLTNGQHNVLDFQNSVRFDKENLRDDYRIRWQPISNFYILYSGYWNEARGEETYSYWDQVVASRLTLDLTSGLYVTLFNTFNYKSYRTDNFYLKDFYRNRLSLMGEWRTSFLGIKSIEYRNETNESLGFQDNDYSQNTIRLGTRNDSFEKFYHNFIVEVSSRNYMLQFDDSLIVNNFQLVGFEGIYEVAVVEKFRLFVEENFLYKVYDQKSSLEPDYYWNFLRPGFRWSFTNQLEVGAGFEWEFKKHIAHPLDSYNVNDQNYISNGIYVSLNYFTTRGMYLNTSASYQWRRYPDSITNDLISIYSNRNIFSVMMLAYIPITSHLNLNGFATFDTDEDIDFDQQNNHSAIFTIELEYTF